MQQIASAEIIPYRHHIENVERERKKTIEINRAEIVNICEGDINGFKYIYNANNPIKIPMEVFIHLSSIALFVCQLHASEHGKFIVHDDQ